MNRSETTASPVSGQADTASLDSAGELARLEKAVYSRAGSAEPVIEVVDPVTGHTLRATASELRLRALQAQLAEESARATGPVEPGFEPSADHVDPTEAPPLIPPGKPISTQRRRFVVPLVAIAAFAVGVTAALIVPAQLAGIGTTTDPSKDSTVTPVAAADTSKTLRGFVDPSEFPDIPIPDLGETFVASSLRNVSGTSQLEQGYGAYLGRSVGSNLYCLIVNTDAVLTNFDCGTSEQVASEGLQVESPVGIRSPETPDATPNETVMTAKLSRLGQFSMWFSPTPS
ncbi:hypothetical protein E3T55_08675 [Cryobacterium frigoriphilum]|uniref:Uncharacterized protein n=1 Tax=Cryobacterium frigoriphilum TaxID=1259150 RepID=A0A4V3IR84_9MICO|nr:hypothetical protein [Cryobacterium frigoriphilum]TFD50498.1 hypothetical protein E3T55_08675 [Cryobacterium frigoriphilum]